MFRKQWLATGFGLLLITVVTAQSPREKQVQQDAYSSAEKTLLATARRLTLSTTRDGGGWKEYQSHLHEKFDRWSAGGQVLNKKDTVAMIQDWVDAGNYMKSDAEKIISIRIQESVGVIRKSVEESYFDADDRKTSSFQGFVTQTWIRQKNGWKLFSVTIQRAEK